MSWVQLRLAIVRADTETMCDLLSELGALSVTLEDAARQPVYEPEPGATPLWEQMTLTALFESDVQVRVALDALRHHFGSSLPQHRLEPLADRAWELEWKRDYQPIDCGGGLWICPRVVEPPKPAKTIVRMEPGLAFGSGTHATTALCLEWVASHCLVDATVVDFGCGSGILGIAALKRGAAHVWAVDHDEQALLATRENAAHNEVAHCLTTLSSAESIPASVNVVLANVLLNPLLALAGEFAGMVQANGSVVLSGILDSQIELLWENYAQWFECEGAKSRDGWACVTGHRKS